MSNSLQVFFGLTKFICKYAQFFCLFRSASYSFRNAKKNTLRNDHKIQALTERANDSNFISSDESVVMLRDIFTGSNHVSAFMTCHSTTAVAFFLMMMDYHIITMIL